MPVCKVCGKTLECINYLHLRVHGYKTSEEYLADYPGAELGAPRLHEKSSRNLTPDRLLADLKEDRRKINIKGESGETEGNFEATATLQMRLKKFKTDYGLTYSASIDKLLEIFYKLREHPVVQEIMGSKLLEADELPENFVPQHREVLQQLLVKYEMMVQEAVKGGNLKDVSLHLEKLARINTILPELEKSYQSNADTKIRQLIEARKLICKNYLPLIVEDLHE